MNLPYTVYKTDDVNHIIIVNNDIIVDNFVGILTIATNGTYDAQVLCTIIYHIIKLKIYNIPYDCKTIELIMNHNYPKILYLKENRIYNTRYCNDSNLIYKLDVYKYKLIRNDKTNTVNVISYNIGGERSTENVKYLFIHTASVLKKFRYANNAYRQTGVWENFINLEVTKRDLELIEYTEHMYGTK